MFNIIRLVKRSKQHKVDQIQIRQDEKGYCINRPGICLDDGERCIGCGTPLQFCREHDFKYCPKCQICHKCKSPVNTNLCSSYPPICDECKKKTCCSACGKACCQVKLLWGEFKVCEDCDQRLREIYNRTHKKEAEKDIEIETIDGMKVKIHTSGRFSHAVYIPFATEIYYLTIDNIWVNHPKLLTWTLWADREKLLKAVKNSTGQRIVYMADGKFFAVKKDQVSNLFFSKNKKWEQELCWWDKVDELYLALREEQKQTQTQNVQRPLPDTTVNKQKKERHYVLFNPNWGWYVGKGKGLYLNKNGEWSSIVEYWHHDILVGVLKNLQKYRSSEGATFSFGKKRTCTVRAQNDRCYFKQRDGQWKCAFYAAENA